MSADRQSRFTLVDTMSEAVAALRQRPLRTALTAIGTVLGVGAFVATTGLATTARAQVSSRFDALRATEVRVLSASPDGTNPFPSDVDDRLGRLNGVNHAGVSYRVDGDEFRQPRATAARPITPTTPIPIVAATPGAVRAALPDLAAGRLYDDFHEGHAERVVLLGRLAADQLGVVRVDHRPVVFIGDVAFTVLGIIDDVRRQPDLLGAIIVPTSTERAELGTVASTYEVLIDVVPGAAQLIGRQAPLALRPDRPDALTSLVPPDPETLRNRVESDVTSFYYALGGLALLIGAVAIANAMLLNTIERRAEIGLRRSLGATRAHVVRQIIVEAAVTGGIAGIAGTALAIYAIAAIAADRGWTPVIEPAIPVAAPLIGLATGAIAGLVPAISAARTEPAVTLRG